MLSESELQRRKPVWSAIAVLWLDTELQDYHIGYIAEAAIDSGYSIEQLNQIYLYEVAPVVAGNMWVSAGVWDAFDDEWLHARAAKRAGKKNRWLRFWIAIGIGRKFLTYATQTEWERVLEKLRMLQLQQESE
jgi:hypothetical protein